MTIALVTTVSFNSLPRLFLMFKSYSLSRYCKKLFCSKSLIVTFSSRNFAISVSLFSSSFIILKNLKDFSIASVRFPYPRISNLPVSLHPLYALRACPAFFNTASPLEVTANA